MDTCLHWIGIVCVAGAALSLFAAAKSYLTIRSEFCRAAKAGEISAVPAGARRLSFDLVFQENAFPGQEASRRRLVRAIATFACLCVAAITVDAADCAQPATSMDQPWFWLATLVVVAIVLLGDSDLTLPVRKLLGYAAIGFGAAMASAHLYLYNLYITGLPRLPQPATGNLIPLNHHGSLVFINSWQSATLIWLQFGAIVLALCGAIIVRYAGKMEAGVLPTTP
jgi:hypothetical protein